MTLKKKYRKDKQAHHDRITEKVEAKAEIRGRLASWYLAHGGAPVKKQADPNNTYDGSSLRTERNLADRISKHNKAKHKDAATIAMTRDINSIKTPLGSPGNWRPPKKEKVQYHG